MSRTAKRKVDPAEKHGAATSPEGFGEAPQAGFDLDTPLSGNVSDWAR